MKNSSQPVTAGSSPAPAENHGDSAGKRRWFGLLVLALGLAMIVIDGTIVGVALPDIIAKLGLNITAAQWVNAIYSVVFAALLLTAGRLADRYGRRSFFIVGVLLFAVGSIVAATSTGLTQLIYSRVLQGIGGACILPATLSTVNATFRGKDRAAAFGIWGAVMSGAAAVGPLLGGWLTSSYGWQWIFWVNIPLAALVLVGAFLFVDNTSSKKHRRGIDVDGTLLSAIGFGSLVFAIIEGPRIGWITPTTDVTLFGMTWGSGHKLSLAAVAFIIAAVALTLFILWEKHRAHNGRDAILELSLFTIPTFTWGNVAAFAVAVGEFGLVFALPLYLVNALGLSILHAGWILAAMALGAFFSGASARHVAGRIGAAGTVVLGLVLEAAGVIALAIVVGTSGNLWLVGGLLIVYGLGLGLASAQLTSTILKDVPHDASGQGSATQSTVRQIGAAVGAATTGAVLSATLPGALHKALAAQGIDNPGFQQIIDAVVASAGGAIDAVRAGHMPAIPGVDMQVLAESLSTGFAHATSYAMASSAVFLSLGLLAALKVRRAS